jgi:hypothetical protein
MNSINKSGDLIYSLPVNQQQEFTTNDMNFLDTLSKKEKYDSEDEEEEDEEEEDEEEENEVENYNDKGSSLWSELKTTTLAGILYILLSLESVNSLILNTGLTGANLLLVKFFIFITIYFILRYKFL